MALVQRKNSIFKIVSFVLLIWSFLFLVIECTSFLCLAFFGQSIRIENAGVDMLVKKFPAQIRVKNGLIRKTFPRALPVASTGNYMSFSFEPAMGFFSEDSWRWYASPLGAEPEEGNLGDLSGFVEKIEGQHWFVILTFGGSTTVWDNWPKYLIDCAEKAGVKDKILVVNAGHWGFMTFNEKIHFSARVLPTLAKLGVKPDLVLSLDGVNDVWARIMGYFEWRKAKTPRWYSHYHGYHQQLDTDLRNLNKITVSGKNFFSALSRAAYNTSIQFLAPLAPYTMQATLAVFHKTINAPEIVKVEEPLEAVELPVEVENEIVAGYRDCLVDFFGASSARGINFVAYLQPVVLEKYYPYPVPDTFYYPGFNHFALNFFRENKHWNRFELNSPVETANMYHEMEVVYEELNRQHPGHFKNLAMVFHDEPDGVQLYKPDAIHYEAKGKRLIAQKIVEDLIGKNMLAVQ